jgi:hypothetical protein
MADKPQFFKEQEIKRLNDTMAICDRVSQTVATKGWAEIIEPLIDKTITDITGCKLPNGRWHSGLLDRARKDERREFYIGYKQALIDLHRRVYGYVDNIQRLKDQREELVKGDTRRPSVPLVDDSPYSPGF